MEAKHVLAGLLMLVVALSSVSFALSQGGNADLGSLSAGKSFLYTFTAEGQFRLFKSHVKSLSDQVTYKITLTTNLKLTIIIADCCVMGDTIALYYPINAIVAASATSPVIIDVIYPLSAGTYTFYVGYTAVPGGFPAEFFVWFIATHG